MSGICRFKTVFKGPVKFWDLRGTGPGMSFGSRQNGYFSLVSSNENSGSINSANIMFLGDLDFLPFSKSSLKS